MGNFLYCATFVTGTSLAATGKGITIAGLRIMSGLLAIGGTVYQYENRARVIYVPVAKLSHRVTC